MTTWWKMGAFSTSKDSLLASSVTKRELAKLVRMPTKIIEKFYRIHISLRYWYWTHWRNSGQQPVQVSRRYLERLQNLIPALLGSMPTCGTDG